MSLGEGNIDVSLVIKHHTDTLDWFALIVMNFIKKYICLMRTDFFLNNMKMEAT